MPHGPRTPGQPLTNDDEGHGNGIGQQVTADGLLVLAVALAEEADQRVQLVLTQALRAQDMRSACSQDLSFLPLPCSRLDPALLAPSGPGFCYRSDLPPSHLPKKTVNWENERVGGIRVKPGGGMAGRVPGYTRESLGVKCKHPQEGAAPCRIRLASPFSTVRVPCRLPASVASPGDPCTWASWVLTSPPSTASPGRLWRPRRGRPGQRRGWPRRCRL